MNGQVKVMKPADGNADRGTWKEAKDSKSSRTYYYNTKTKETTWTKPIEMATDAERVEMIRKKEETKNFFEDMEHNIMNKVLHAQTQHSSSDHHGHGDDDNSNFMIGDETDDTDSDEPVHHSQDVGIEGPGGNRMDPVWNTSEFKFSAKITRSESRSTSSRSSSGLNLAAAAAGGGDTIGIEGPGGISYRIRTISSLDDDIFDFIHKKRAAAAAAAADAIAAQSSAQYYLDAKTVSGGDTFGDQCKEAMGDGNDFSIEPFRGSGLDEDGGYSIGNPPDQPTNSTHATNSLSIHPSFQPIHAINPPSQLTPSTHPVKTPYQLTLSNPPSPPTFSTRPLNSLCHPALSTISVTGFGSNSPHNMSRAMSREGSVDSLRRMMSKEEDHRRCTSAPLLPLSGLLGPGDPPRPCLIYMTPSRPV